MCGDLSDTISLDIMKITALVSTNKELKSFFAKLDATKATVKLCISTIEKTYLLQDSSKYSSGNNKKYKHNLKTYALFLRTH